MSFAVFVGSFKSRIVVPVCQSGFLNIGTFQNLPCMFRKQNPNSSSSNIQKLCVVSWSSATVFSRLSNVARTSLRASSTVWTENLLVKIHQHKSLALNTPRGFISIRICSKGVKEKERNHNKAKRPNTSMRSYKQ